ncbi:MAG: hypothetical protein AzoDbin1_01391 [Azoarcus sp.]|uniref:Uncharacterized protein n=1 Tax=Aromatoleum tolulyticum TaxID=34027 RepID=A0A1N7A382_9RHOO|nr:hypothetical protein [Aromatoleum tolulyticum]MCK9984919.1 hypothetical protein [Azoarcus sp.]SIR33473.1 hypothetical protein SAMN05421829_11363 [Aromatoleum tolulyticum]
MRTFIAFTIVLCTVGGLWLLQGPAFFWPDRFDPSQGVFLGGFTSQLLGGGLLAIAAAGLMAIAQARRGRVGTASQGWQIRYFVLILLAIGLVSAAFNLGERGPNPDWRAPDNSASPT